MLWKYFICPSLLLFLSNCLIGQARRTIYLGPSADSLFVSGLLVSMDSLGSKTFYEFLDYRTFRHESIGNTNETETKRDGILLPAKRTENLHVKAEATFGKHHDTCFIVYNASIEKITEGRSAAISLLNLFSKKEDKSPQDDPQSHVRHISVKGKIATKGLVADFEYHNNFNKDYLLGGLSGNILIDADTILLQPCKTYLTKKSKKKKGYAGLQLVKGEKIYAAVDTYDTANRIIYMDKTLSEEQKSAIASYLFIIACYMNYFPPFIDMTPA